MRLTLKIQCDNAAYDDDLYGEIARNLRDVAARIEETYSGGSIRDANGNEVGEFSIKGYAARERERRRRS